MIEMRNVLKTKLNKKGFTLAELLVVVAIIAILVAVSIPIFTGKLNEAKKNTDLANERAAKAAIVTEYLSDQAITVGYYNAKDGSIVSNFADAGTPYNQVEQNGNAAKTAVVKVTITENASATGDKKPTVKVEWVKS